MTKIIITLALTFLVVSMAFGEAKDSGNIVYLHCGDFGSKNIVKENVYENPQVHMFYTNESKNFFIVIDFNKKMMHRYPHKYSSDMSPFFDESKKITRPIIPTSYQVLNKPGVAYLSWISVNPFTSFFDEYVYITSKLKMLGKEKYFGGILTKVETSLITTAQEPIPQVIKPSVVVSQYLCSKVFDFSRK